VDSCPGSLSDLTAERPGNRFLPFRTVEDIGDSPATLFQWYIPPTRERDPVLWLGRYYDLAHIYLDGVRVWNTRKENGLFRGIEWHILPLPGESVEVTACFEKGQLPSFSRPGFLDPMLIGSAVEILEYLFRKEMDDLAIMSISMALSISGLAIFFFIVPIRTRSVLFLSLLLLVMSLYQLGTSSMAQLMIPYTWGRLLVFMLGSALFPPIFGLLLCEIFSSKWLRRISWGLMGVSLITMVHALTLGGMHIAGWPAMFSGFFAPIMLLGGMITSVSWIFRGLKSGWLLLITMLPFFLSALFEYLGVVYSFWGENAFSGRWTYLVFQVGLAVVVLAQANRTRKEREKSQEMKYESGRSVAENRYRTLQERMAPHFLFNSLNLIHSYIERGNPRAGDAIMMLASHYRYLINDMERRLVLFDQEWEFSRRYCQLVQFRFEDHLRIEMERHGDFSGVFIPPLTIQPIIENAYRHGLRDYTSKGVIEVLAHADHDQVRIQVLDNGRGIDQNSVYVSSIGGVERRLKENFTQARVTMSRRTERGTCVDIVYSLEPLDLEEED
tara:strand:- start:42291 stop:43958 length:1668 start_codon:yes stop_codon:yes gene_type:complete